MGRPWPTGDDLAADLGEDTSTDLGPDIADAEATTSPSTWAPTRPTRAMTSPSTSRWMCPPLRERRRLRGRPARPRVRHTTTGACVACTAASDRCPTGQYCRENTCVAGRRNDDACEPPRADDAGVDAGREALRRSPAATPPPARASSASATSTAPRAPSASATSCVSGCNAGRARPGQQQCCAGACIEVSSNVANCGGCGMTCTVANAAPSCQNGMRAVGTCTAPFSPTAT
ncbi:MAG: hypothetical protein R3A52_12695 [Polyangiales bacterium]